MRGAAWIVASLLVLGGCATAEDPPSSSGTGGTGGKDAGKAGTGGSSGTGGHAGTGGSSGTGGTGGTPPDASADGATDASVDVDATVPDGIPDVVVDIDPASCITVSSAALEVAANDRVSAKLNPQVAGAQLVLNILWRGGVFNPIDPGTYPLGEGVNANMSSCSQCVYAGDGTSPTFFFAYAGSIDVQSVEIPFDGQSTAKLRDVVLVEVEQVGAVTVPVADGACLLLEDVAWNTGCPLAGDPCDAATGCCDFMSTCDNGVCTCTAPGTEACDWQCISTAADTDHCGACGNACATSESCIEGHCGLPVSVEVSGLCGAVTLTNNGADNLTINADGAHTFALPVRDGEPYNVEVAAQPATQTCVVAGGQGTVQGAAVTGVTVECTGGSAVVSGTVEGLAAGHSAALVLNGDTANTQTISANGTFAFAANPLDCGDGFDVAVSNSTPGAPTQCFVFEGIGIAGQHDATHVSVVCDVPSYVDEAATVGAPGSLTVLSNDSVLFPTPTGHDAVTGTGWSDVQMRRVLSNLVPDPAFNGPIALGIPQAVGAGWFAGGVFGAHHATASNLDVIVTGEVVGDPPCAGTSRPHSLMTVRANQLGVLDAGFATGGVDLESFLVGCGPEYASRGRQVAAQSSGTLVVGGDSYEGTASTGKVALIRLTATGSADASFGTSGKATLAPPTGATANALVRMRVLSDDRILLLARYLDAAGIPSSQVMRLTAAGQPDPTFASGAPVVLSAAYRDMAVTSGGEIVLTGGQFAANYASPAHLALTRLTSAGLVDGAFANGGAPAVDFALWPGWTATDAWGDALVELPNGAWIVAGSTRENPPATAHLLFLARFTSGGAIDTNFHDDGLLVLRDTGRLRYTALALQSTGHVVTALGEYSALPPFESALSSSMLLLRHANP